ncbi:hypothetical protein D3C74_372960 [compost metagenome]
MLELERPLHMGTCQGIRLQQPLVATFIYDGTATAAGVWPDIDDMICQLDYIGIMLDDNYGIAFISQLLQQFI